MNLVHELILPAGWMFRAAGGGEFGHLGENHNPSCRLGKTSTASSTMCDAWSVVCPINDGTMTRFQRPEDKGGGWKPGRRFRLTECQALKRKHFFCQEMILYIYNSGDGMILKGIFSGGLRASLDCCHRRTVGDLFTHLQPGMIIL